MSTRRVLSTMWELLAKLPPEKRQLMSEDLAQGNEWFKAKPQTRAMLFAAWDEAYENIHGED